MASELERSKIELLLINYILRAITFMSMSLVRNNNQFQFETLELNEISSPSAVQRKISQRQNFRKVEEMINESRWDVVTTVALIITES